MILYEFVCENQKIVGTLISSGVIPTNIHFNISVYKSYLTHRQTCKRIQAVENTAQDYGNCFNNIYNIVRRMEQSV